VSPVRRPAGLQLRLLLSYLVVLAIALGAVALGVRLIAPALFNRLMDAHMQPGGMGAAMTAAMRSITENAFQEALVQAIVLAVVVATLVAVGVSVFVTTRITTPIRRLARASQLIARGEYRVRVDTDEPDEIGDLAESFNRMAEALESTERRRVALIADVAHELRTPLATLQGYLEGLVDGVVTPSTDLWPQLHEQTTRMSRLVQDLEELSRVESGAAPVHPAPVSPDALVEAAIAGVAPRFAERDVALRVALTARLPDVLVDRDRGLQVLTNLLTNALRYTPAGGTVTVSAAGDEDAVRFQVRDTGVGIPAAHLPRLFDRFYRVDPSRTRAQGGSGIGLTIARALVEAHGGRIWAESVGRGEGSTFSFTLPLARGPHPAGS